LNEQRRSDRSRGEEDCFEVHQISTRQGEGGERSHTFLVPPLGEGPSKYGGKKREGVLFHHIKYVWIGRRKVNQSGLIEGKKGFRKGKEREKRGGIVSRLDNLFTESPGGKKVDTFSIIEKRKEVVS